MPRWDVTRRRYVRRIPRSPPGLVTYRNEYTIARKAHAIAAARYLTISFPDPRQSVRPEPVEG